jgi:hypothetical protein
MVLLYVRLTCSYDTYVNTGVRSVNMKRGRYLVALSRLYKNVSFGSNVVTGGQTRIYMNAVSDNIN